MQEEETATPEAATEASEEEAPEAPEATEASQEAGSETSEGKGKAKRGADKTRRSHGERAMANVRSAKKGQREVSDPVERAQFLLAEANVLALLELADAIGGGSTAVDAAVASDAPED